MDSLEKMVTAHQNEASEVDIQKANEASAIAIRESYNTIVLIHRHVWIECD